MKESNIIWNSQHGFSKGKSWQTTMIGFCDKMTRFVEARRRVDAIYLVLIKAFNTVS